MTRALLIALACAACTVGGEDAVAHLESRLLAPCCWMQTLDAHESPIARELRDEIARRVRRGESAAAIEADLVARYGERIRAVPAGSDDRTTTGVAVGGFALAVLACVLVARRWVRAGRARPEVVAPVSDPALEDRLDDELDGLED